MWLKTLQNKYKLQFVGIYIRTYNLCLFIGNKIKQTNTGFYGAFVHYDIVKHMINSKLGSMSDSAGKRDIVNERSDNSHTPPPLHRK